MLIPIYGMKGAFLASFAAHIVLNIIYVYFSHKIISFTENISLFLLFVILLINYILQLLIFSDTSKFLAITIILNILLIISYFVIISKKNSIFKK